MRKRHRIFLRQRAEKVGKEIQRMIEGQTGRKTRMMCKKKWTVQMNESQAAEVKLIKTTEGNYMI